MAITWGLRPCRCDGALDRIAAAVIRRLFLAAICRFPVAVIRWSSQGETTPETTPQTGSEVAHFSVLEVVQFSMSVDPQTRQLHDHGLGIASITQLCRCSDICSK
jgi:hypothetical protein